MDYDVKVIDRERLRKGWSKADLAKRAKTSPANVSLVLAGKNQHPPTVSRVAKAVGIDIATLVLEPVAARGGGRR